MRCPTCDGAMIEKPVPRCVRCGPLKPKDESLQELLDRGVKLRIEGPPKYRRYASIIDIVNTPYRLTVGYRGVLLTRPWRPGDYDMGTVLVKVDPRTPFTDTAYWDQVRSEVFALLPNHGNLATFLWKRVRAYRFEEQRRSWEEVLPPNIVQWAREVLAEDSKDADCVDNYRVACTRISSQRRRYFRQRKAGCCGFRDFTRDGPDGQLYLLGYNYGH